MRAELERRAAMAVDLAAAAAAGLIDRLLQPANAATSSRTAPWAGPSAK